MLALCGCGSSGSSAESAANVARGAGSAVSLGGGTGRSPDRPPARPNIVFVLTDDLAWNLVPYMPHVLDMERRGETFSNYFVTDSLCCPSRASILTGRFPHDTHVVGNGPPYGGYAVFHQRGEERETFATALQAKGYRTALMGKYLNGYQPVPAEGFAPSVPIGWNEWDVVGDGYREFDYAMNSNGTIVDYGHEPQEYLTDVLAEKGIDFIDRAAAQRRPFMLEMATFAPHSPFVPAPRDEGGFPGLQAPRTPAFDAAAVGAPAWLRDFAPLEPRQAEQIDEQFRRRAQAVQAVDRLIAEIEATLVARGVARNTYIVFSSDNGLHMGEHRLMPGKQTAFDTDIHVPLIVLGPGVPAGREVAAMTENIDLCPTFERLGGARVGANVDGHSLLPLLSGRGLRSWRDAVLIEHHGPDLLPSDPDLPTRGAGNPPSYEALRTPTSLYVEYVDGEREYYNLRRDPFELHNLAVHLSPERERRLHGALAGAAACHGRRSCWRAQRGV